MEKKFTIDEITWNDLNMEDVYERLNHACSSVGQEYLKKTLKTLELAPDVLEMRDAKAESLKDNESLVGSLQKVFKGLGKTKKVSFLDHIFKIKEIKTRSNAVHIVLVLLLLAAIALIFVKPAFGIVALVIMIAVNIIIYFKYKAEVEGYFNSLKYLVSMVIAASKILKLNCPEPFSRDMESLKEAVHVFAPLKRGSWLITNSVSGSLIDVLMDYIRMIFHVDLMKFNSMKKCAEEHEEEILTLYNTLGEIETAICIYLMRKDTVSWCRPSFINDKEIHAKEIYHPLVSEPVKNSIETGRSILLTGSNASGKSTFLKTVAINQIFAQTLYTCLADSWVSGFFKVLSSMALTDNLLGEESYFIVEIKSLKRIFDTIDTDVPVLAFIDEVLRGTNTTERIAASSQILKKLSNENALIFAATHDIELTKLLEKDMENYHFTEHVEDGNVLFDYKLKEGSATSRNAIKLLKAYGFDPDITEAAEAMAK
ncbi:MAG: hypothetical protein IKE48_04960 [Parasporobacterium sp.]|nr:hypothetical protein [Parasporobacterium sp.]